MKKSIAVLGILFFGLISCLFGTFPVLADSSQLGQEGWLIRYRVYQEPSGWTDYAVNGNQLGGEEKIDALEVNLPDSLMAEGGLEYRSHNEDIGWSGWNRSDSGQAAGEPGKGMQAVRLKLTGKLAHIYDIYYRVHVPNVGWSNWGRNGQACGSEGLSRNISIIQITLTNKGDLPGENVGNAFTQAKWMWPLPPENSYISSYFGPRNSTHHDGFDIPAPEGTPIFAVKSGVVKMSGENGNFGNCVAVELDSGEEVYNAHMVRVNVSVGQRVSKGQVIGFVGTTGNSLGNHLHFEMYDDSGNLVDPYNYFR